MPRFTGGELRPLVHRVYPMPQARRAFRIMQQARHVGKIVLTVPQPAAVSFRPDATYLISGGLGALGLEVARWMVGQGARHLLLVGRRAPTEEAAAVIAELEKAAAQVHVAQVDIARAEDVARVLAETGAALPPLRGVVHAAGILDDGILNQQSWKRFETVLAPKVQGACNLHGLTQDRTLDFFALFSSTAAMLGSPGQGNYAAANAFLNGLAHYRRLRGLPALTISWSAWAQAGMASRPEVLGRLRAIGLRAIEPEQGLRAVEQVWCQRLAQVGVLPVEWPTFLAQFPAGREPTFLRTVADEACQRSAAGPGASSALRAQLQEAAPAERLEILAAYLQKQVARVLGLDAARLPDRRTGFTALGLDSLMAVELRNRLQEDLGAAVSLPATLIFDYPTIEALAGNLAREVLHLEGPEESAPEVPPEEQVRAKALAEVGHLSEQEMAQLIDSELADLQAQTKSGE